MAGALVLMSVSGHTSYAFAQEAQGWSDVQYVFRDASGLADVKPASIVADSTGTAHLFWFFKADRDDRSTWSINYASYRNGVWSEPNDILLTPGGGAGGPRAKASPDGRLHVIWVSRGRLWYSHSRAETAWDAKSWTIPMSIASGPQGADIAVDSGNRLHVVYAIGGSGQPVYYMNSQDGIDWPLPTIAHELTAEGASPAVPRLSVDGKGRIHITWTEYRVPGGWPPLGQWYARSVDDGATWEKAIQVGELDQGQGTIHAIGDNEIHLVWRGRSRAGNTYHQWSNDGGGTWQGPTAFDPDGGFSGGQSLASDSAGNLHLVRGDGGYQRWDGSEWTPVPALFTDSGETGTLAIGLGNRIHWVNTSSSSSETAAVMHRVASTTAQALAARSLATPVIFQAPVVEPSRPAISPTSPSHDMPVPLGGTESQPARISAADPLLAGTISAFLITGAVLVLARGILRRGP